MYKKSAFGALVMVVSAVVVIVVSGCMKPKGTTLTGEAKGYNETVKVTILVDDSNKILDFSATQENQNNPDPSIGAKAIQQLKDKIIGLNSKEDVSNLDTISGATYTSYGVLDAVGVALDSKQ